MSATILLTGLEIAKIGAQLLTQQRTDTAAAMAEIIDRVLQIIPTDDLKSYLDAADRKAIDTAADVAEETKLEKENES